MEKSREHRQRVRKRKGFLILIVLGVLLVYGVFFVERALKPSMEAMAEVRAKSIVTELVTAAVRRELVALGDRGDMLTVEQNEEGRVTLIQADSAAMSSFSTDIVREVQAGLAAVEAQTLRVPLGSLLGSPVLSQTPPYVNLKIESLGSAKAEFQTSFEEQGINQVRYRVYLTVSCQTRVIVPFSQNQVQVDMTLPISEVVVVGEIPETYIFVPEEDILDATF
ncbi:MAG: sporulation protein YunB [Bacillota bacterium]|nr:sporulation protein YunB [Bacillota bacterium]